MERIVAITEAGKTKAYPFSSLRKAHVVEDAIDSTRYVVLFEGGMRTAIDSARVADSRDVGAVGVFSPELDARALSFQYKNGAILDHETGSTWNVLGIATDGPLSGHQLKPIEHTVAFAFAWLAFRPETEIVRPSQPVR
jgi:hypothetical protein